MHCNDGAGMGEGVCTTKKAMGEKREDRKGRKEMGEGNTRGETRGRQHQAARLMPCERRAKKGGKIAWWAPNRIWLQCPAMQHQWHPGW